MVLEGSRGAGAAEEAVLASQVRVALVLCTPPFLFGGGVGSGPQTPLGVAQALTRLCCTPLSYLCFRLLGTALPLLSKEQLPLVMKGDLIRHFGEHMVTAKVGIPPPPAAQHCQEGQATPWVSFLRRLLFAAASWSSYLGGPAGELGVPSTWWWFGQVSPSGLRSLS